MNHIRVVVLRLTKKVSTTVPYLFHQTQVEMGAVVAGGLLSNTELSGATNGTYGYWRDWVISY
jgi:hypothetical protein